MNNLHILNSRERSQLFALLRQQFGFTGSLDYVFLQHQDGNIFISNRSLFDLDFSALRVNSIGLYFGELKPDGLRLSIEGSQIIGPGATKNIITLPDAQKELWMKGESITYDKKETGFVLVQHMSDFLGSGKLVQGKLLNYVPKARRLMVINA